MQLVRDTAFDILGEFQSDVSESLSRGANFYLTTGSQADEPQGIQGAVSVANAAWNAITHPNILRLMHSVDASYRRSNKCAFMCNDATVLAMKLTLIDADGRPLYKSQPNAVGGFDYVIEGKPVKINPDLADGQLLFGDFSKYHIRLVGGVMIQVLRELFALTGGIGIIGHSSIDGRLVDSTAIKKLVVA
jgi:HK97 family phage major capsid protein